MHGIRAKLASAAAVLAIVGGATLAGAGTANATIGCTGGDGCNHQTGIFFNDGEYPKDGTTQWHSLTLTLKIQSDGNFVLYCAVGGKAVWATDTALSLLQQASQYRDVQFQKNGNMTIWNVESASGYKSPAWNTNTPGAHEAIVQADGNFVIYDASGNALWSSGTYHVCPGTAGYWG